MTHAGLGAPDGAPGKAYLSNRVGAALYALAKQQEKTISLNPNNLTEIQYHVGDQMQQVYDAKIAIDTLIQ